jgi:hypothetical protein
MGGGIGGGHDQNNEGSGAFLQLRTLGRFSSLFTRSAIASNHRERGSCSSLLRKSKEWSDLSSPHGRIR